MSEEFKVGDIVKINIGKLESPTMTVRRVEKDIVTCIWFVETKLYTAEFNKSELKTYAQWFEDISKKQNK